MKTLKLISCLLITFLTSESCTINEDLSDVSSSMQSSNRQSQNFMDINNPLHFKWGLYHLSGGFAGFNEYYSYGQITRKFDYEHQSFHVLNLANSFPSGGYLATGVYPCNITANPDGTFCFSNGSLSGCSVLNSNILYLSEGKVADGIELQLVH